MRKVRTSSILLCLFVVLGLFSACAPSDTDKDPTNSNGQTVDPPKQEEEFKYRDQTFHFIGSFIRQNERDWTEETSEKYAEDPPIYSYEDSAMMDRVLDIEEKYDIQIYISDVNYWIWDTAEFGAAVATGEVGCDFFHSQIDWGRDLFIGGFVVPIKDLRSFDSTDVDKWGSSNTQMASTYHGVLWGFPWHGSVYMPFPMIYYGEMMCKNDVYASFGVDQTPQEMVENKDWTFENFHDLLPQVSNSDPSNLVVGFAFPSGLPMMAVYANGGDKVVYDEDQGKYVFGLTKSNAINAIEWAREIISMEGYAMESGDVSLLWKNKVTFLITNGNRAFYTIPAETDDYSFLPFPYGPDAEYGKTYSSYLTQIDSVVGVFRNPGLDTEREQASARLLNEITEPLTDGYFPDGYDAYLFRNYFEEGDEFSFNVYKEMGLNMHWDFSLDLDTANQTVATALFKVVSSKNSAAEVMGSIEQTVNEALDLSMNYHE